MKCEECKNHLLTSVQEMPEPAHSHIQDCPECHEYYDQISQLEQSMQDAVQVAIPMDLSESIFKCQKRKRFMRLPTYLGAVATTVVIAFFAYIVLFSAPTIDRMILAHVEKEPFTLTTIQNPSMHDINMTLATMDIEMQKPVKVRFLKRCLVNDKLIAHMVIEGEKGPVTVLLMPNETLSKESYFTDVQLDGFVTPVGNRGSIAVVGFKGEPVEAISKQMMDSFSLTL